MCALLMCSLAEGVRGAVTTHARAAHAPVQRCLSRRAMIGNSLPELASARMALQTSGVGERLFDVDFLDRFIQRKITVLAKIIVADVSHAVQLGEHVTIHPVVGVAFIAALVAKHRVARVTGGEGLGLRIGRVGKMRVHDMAGAAELTMRSFLQARDGGCPRSQRRQGGDGHEQEQPPRDAEWWPFEPVHTQNCHRTARGNYRDPAEPRHPAQGTGFARGRPEDGGRLQDN